MAPRGRGKKQRTRKRRLQDQAIKAGRGQFVYEAMTAMRRDDGRAWTVSDLAAAMGIKRLATVQKWFHGGEMKVPNMQRLANATGLSFAQVAEGCQDGDVSHISRLRLLDLYRQALGLPPETIPRSIEDGALGPIIQAGGQ